MPRSSHAPADQQRSTLCIERYFEERAARADIPRALGILERAGKGDLPVSGNDPLD